MFGYSKNYLSLQIMRIIGLSRLNKLKVKNRGNIGLWTEIDKLINDLETFEGYDLDALKRIRKDADCVHDEGFYFFDIQIHRTLLLIELAEDKTATIVWVGNHQDYEKTFRNNKKVIEKWLRTRNYIR